MGGWADFGGLRPSINQTPRVRPNALSCKTDNLSGEALPQRKPQHVGVRMSMNETVYLFALSVPALLEALVARQAGPSRDARPQDDTERSS